jgi:hypothetical protein
MFLFFEKRQQNKRFPRHKKRIKSAFVIHNLNYLSIAVTKSHFFVVVWSLKIAMA